VNKTAASAAQS